MRRSDAISVSSCCSASVTFSPRHSTCTSASRSSRASVWSGPCRRSHDPSASRSSASAPSRSPLLSAMFASVVRAITVCGLSAPIDPNCVSSRSRSSSSAAALSSPARTSSCAYSSRVFSVAMCTGPSTSACRASTARTAAMPAGWSYSQRRSAAPSRVDSTNGWSSPICLAMAAATSVSRCSSVRGSAATAGSWARVLISAASPSSDSGCSGLSASRWIRSSWLSWISAPPRSRSCECTAMSVTRADSVSGLSGPCTRSWARSTSCSSSRALTSSPRPSQMSASSALVSSSSGWSGSSNSSRSAASTALISRSATSKWPRRHIIRP